MFGIRFLTVTNFQEMLIKLTFWHFVAAIVCLLILDSNINFSNDILKDLTVNYKGINFPVSIIIFASLWAIVFSHIFKLHDRISDVFRIRFRYDQKYILRPIADSVIGDDSKNIYSKLEANRHNAMSNVFYKYASSTEANPLVGKHNIHQALTTFSWYWICLEVIFTSFLTFLAILIINCEFSLAALGLSVMFLIFSFLLSPQLKKYTKIQTDRIVADIEAAKSIRTYLNAL